MKSEVASAVKALDELTKALSTAWTDQPFNQAINGWNIVPLSRADLAGRSKSLRDRLVQIPDEKIHGELSRKLSDLPRQITWFRQQTLPQLGSGNLPQVVSNFDSIMSNIEASLPFEQFPSWEEVASSNLVPRELAKRIRSLEARLSQLGPRANDLEAKVDRINEAHGAALELPTDLQALVEARDEVSKSVRFARDAAQEAQNSAFAAVEGREKIDAASEEVAQLIRNIHSAYSAATTAGLAASFTERAASLNRSMWWWVGLLLLALITGGVVGARRLSDFQDILNHPNMPSQWIWVSATMSLLAIAAPVWFAWLATRQISQRFRLAEDYGFKASVARAYEGYRREVARLDPELEARLFASALDRLEEAPLRFLSVEEHGSPYEALLASAGFQKALDKIPTLRAMAQTAIDRATASSSHDGSSVVRKVRSKSDQEEDVA